MNKGILLSLKQRRNKKKQPSPLLTQEFHLPLTFYENNLSYCLDLKGTAQKPIKMMSYIFLLSTIFILFVLIIIQLELMRGGSSLLINLETTRTSRDEL